MNGSRARSVFLTSIRVIPFLVAAFFLLGDFIPYFLKSKEVHDSESQERIESAKKKIAKPIIKPIAELISEKKLTVEQILQKTFPSVAFLMMKDKDGLPAAIGNGFFIREDILATNLTLLKGAREGVARFAGKGPKYPVVGTVGIEANVSLALLSVKKDTGPYLKLGDSRRVQIGDEVLVVGNPLGLEGNFYRSIVSGVRIMGSNPFFQLTTSISPVSTGAPVMNMAGEVIGVALSISQNGQRMSLALPASYLHSLLTRMTLPEPLSKAEEMNGPSMEAFEDRALEGVYSTLFEWYPAHYYLHEFGQLRTGHKERYYSFSLHNRLDLPVKNVVCWVIFYTHKNGKPIDYLEIRCPDTIPPGLAKRVKGSVSSSVVDAVPPREIDGKWEKAWPDVQIRVVDYEILG